MLRLSYKRGKFDEHSVVNRSYVGANRNYLASALRPDGSVEGVAQSGTGIFRGGHRYRRDLRVRRCENVAALIHRQCGPRIRNPDTVVMELAPKQLCFEAAHHFSTS